MAAKEVKFARDARERIAEQRGTLCHRHRREPHLRGRLVVPVNERMRATMDAG